MAAHFDLNITQGSSFSVRLAAVDNAGQAIDLTPWSLRGIAKIKFSSGDKLIDLNPHKVPNHHTSGYVDINLTAAQTALLPVTEGVYDIEMFDGNGYVKKLILGYVRIYPETTT
tara:strand:+ start:266 stop:607 length:342 start_codon:yes stop_codon:yes gene_type:complete